MSTSGGGGSSSDSVSGFRIQGWLTKEGGSIKTWRKRWCILDQHQLFYFSSPDDVYGDQYPRKKGSIEISCECVAQAEEYKKKPHGFYIQTPSNGRRYHFSADNSDDREAWLAELNRTIRSSPQENLVNAKFIVVGPSFAGKTCLIRRWTESRFVEAYTADTTSESFQKILPLEDGFGCLLEIWDVFGNQVPEEIPHWISQGANTIVYVFDITSKGSFGKMKRWVHSLRSQFRNVPVILVGMKADLEDQRAVSAEVAETFAEDLKAPYIEASAKTGALVSHVFELAVDLLYRTGIIIHAPLFSG